MHRLNSFWRIDPERIAHIAKVRPTLYTCKFKFRKLVKLRPFAIAGPYVGDESRGWRKKKLCFDGDPKLVELDESSLSSQSDEEKELQSFTEREF